MVTVLETLAPSSVSHLYHLICLGAILDATSLRANETNYKSSSVVFLNKEKKETKMLRYTDAQLISLEWNAVPLQENVYGLGFCKVLSVWLKCHFQ